MGLKCYALDAHFYCSVVGSECDKGRGQRLSLIQALVKCSSLDEKEAAEVVDTCIAKGVIVSDDEGNHTCV